MDRLKKTNYCPTPRRPTIWRVTLVNVPSWAFQVMELRVAPNWIRPRLLRRRDSDG